MDSKLDKIHDNGWDAGYEGIGTNPHTKDTAEYKAWNDGFANGQSEKEIDEG